MENTLNTSTVSILKTKTKTDNRYAILIFCALIQLGVGINYIWSVFQPHVMKTFGWNSHTASMTYTISILVFVLGSSFGGKVQAKLSPKAIMFFSGIVMSAGAFLAAFTPSSSPFWLYATWGALTGFAMGIVYNTAVTLCQKWFFDKKGFASGVVVSSLGFSGIMFTPVFNYTLSAYGVKTTFIIISIFFLTVNTLSSLFLKNPPAGYGVQEHSETEVYTTKQFSPKEMMRTPNFYVLILALTCGCTAYILNSPMLIVIGTERGISLPILLSGVMAFSFSNAIGRLISATLSDIIGRKLTLIILYSISLLACAGLIFASGYLLIVLFCLIAFSYGGFFATFPSVTSDSFGLKHAGANYGLVMLGLGFASLTSILLSEIIYSMRLATSSRFIFSLIFAAVGIVFIALIKKPKQD